VLLGQLVQHIIRVGDIAVVGGLDRGDIAAFVIRIRDGCALVDKVLNAGRTLSGDRSPDEVFF